LALVCAHSGPRRIEAARRARNSLSTSRSAWERARATGTLQKPCSAGGLTPWPLPTREGEIGDCLFFVRPGALLGLRLDHGRELAPVADQEFEFGPFQAEDVDRLGRPYGGAAALHLLEQADFAEGLAGAEAGEL